VIAPARLACVTAPARKSADDEVRWAEAQSILDRTPTESAEVRLRRSRRLRLGVIVGLALVLTTAITVAFLLVSDPARLRPERDPATPQVVLGFVLSVVALVVMLVGVVGQVRATRRMQAYRSPLYVLNRAQRKQLVSEVRGRTAAVPEHVPLARHLAELLLLQRFAVSWQAAWLVSQAGLWIAQPATWRLWLVGLFLVAVVGSYLAGRRQAWAARRFLKEHPAPDGLSR
jgi:hypothetical protein